MVSRGRTGKLISILFVIFFLLVLPSTAEVVNYTENNVDDDSNVDSVDNVGNSGTSTYAEAQNFDGSKQVITEKNTGGETDNWAFYKNIIVQNNAVLSDLTDFPVFIYIIDEDLKEKAQPDGDDIAFFNESGHQIPHEIEIYNPNYNSSHAELTAWTRLDLYGSRDTRITLKYGNSTMENQESPQAVWQDSYDNVYHLADDPSISGNSTIDSLYNNNGTSLGSMTSDDSVLGKTGNAINFDGIDDFIDVGDIHSDSWDQLTLSGWINKEDTGDDIIFAVANSTSTEDTVFSLIARDDFFRARIGTDGSFGGPAANNLDTPAGTFVPNQWQHVSLIWDGVDVYIYVDGQSQWSSGKWGSTLIDDTEFRPSGLNGTIANTNRWNARFFNGRIDELRIGRYAHSSGWIATEFNNQNDTSSFYTVSNEHSLTTEDVVDTDTIDIDTSQDHLGTQSNFYDLMAKDELYNNLSEGLTPLNSHSLHSSGSAYVTIGNGQAAWNSQIGTISFWVKFDDLSVVNRPWGLHTDMEIRTSADSLIIDWGGASSLSVSGLSTGMWYFFAVIWDESANNLRLYSARDSIEPYEVTGTSSWTGSVSSLSVTENNFLASRGGQSPIRGDADELRYYDTAVTLSELQSTYNVSLIGNEPNLRSYYQLNTDYGDLGPDGNDFNPVNSPYFSTDIQTLEQKVTGFNQEFQWVDIPYETVSTNLSIYTGALDSENLIIDYWNGDTWSNLITGLVANGWNNISLNGILTSSVLTLRFHDSIISSDSIQSSWELDVALLQYTNYELQWEHQSQSVDTSNEYHMLTVHGNSSDTETFDIQLWNQSTLSWSQPLGLTIDSSQWYNISISDLNIVSSTITWRYISSNITKDNVQTSLQIDFAGIQSYTSTPQVVVNPSDIEYDEGTTGHNLVWSVTDDHPDTFVLYRNGSQINSNTWSSGVDISISVDNLERGLYNYTLVLTDDYSSESTDQVWVTVNDVTSPEVNAPADKEINESSTNNFINWTATDLHPETYNIYQNSSLQDTGVWVSGNSIDYNIDALPKGVYNITIEFVDDSGNSIADNVIVTVIDETAPVIENVPEDLVLEENSQGNWINWTLTENHPDSYKIYKNGSLIKSGLWSSEITYNVDHLLRGNYNYTIIILDDTGNRVVDTVMVTVFDETPPTVSHPEDITYSEGTTGHYIVWDVYDNHPNQFVIYINGTEDVSFGWNSGQLKYNIDGFSVGKYNITLFLTDEDGNSISDTVYVIVEDTTSPDLNSPSDIIYTEGSTGHTIEWTATDLHPDTYEIYRESVVIDTGYWVSGGDIIIDIDGLSVATYNFTILVVDQSGNQQIDTVIVEVTSEPVFRTIPEDIDYIYGDTNNELSWTASDADPNSYEIYRNGSQISTGNWDSDIAIIENVDGLNYGLYNYTIVLNDSAGNSVTDTAWVKVSDNPQWIDRPNDLEYPEGTTDYWLYWNSTDLEPANYIVYLNNTEYQTGTWSNATDISVNIGGLELGTYNFTIIVYDTSGNSISDVLILTVNDVTKPSVNQPDNLTYNETDVDNYLSWTPTDNHPDYYNVYRNNSVQIVSPTAWTSGTTITINVDGLSKGFYNYTIYLYDTSGNVQISTVNVTVLDGTMPDIKSPLDTTYSVSNITGNSLEFNTTDSYPGSYDLYRNDSLIQYGTWDYVTNISYTFSSLGKGIYNFTIYVNDTSGNFNTATVWITVVDTTEPNFVQIPVDETYSESDVTKTINWIGNDSYSGIYEVYINSSFHGSGNWTSSSEVVYDLSDLTKGTYNIDVIIYDESGNSISHSISVVIEDNSSPQPVTTPSNTTMVEGLTIKLVNWTMTDNYPSTYDIYQNNSEVIINETWSSNVEIRYNVTELPYGLYNITIVVYDDSGNSFIDTVWITIEDRNAPDISHPPDISYEQGSTSNRLIWEGTDLHPDNYKLFRDGVSIQNGTWNSSSLIDINIDGLTVGEYTYIIYIYDQSGNVSNDTVLVTVVDETPPTISALDENPRYHEGNTGNNITWEISDLNLNSYNIYNESVLLRTGTWESVTSDTLIIDIDGLLIGEYNYTIIVFDSEGNTRKHTVWVQVIETDPPDLIDYPTDFEMNESKSDVIISWTATDSYNHSYDILLEGVLNKSGYWTNNNPITYNISSLELKKGTYTVFIVIRDTSGNEVNNTVIITVVDGTSPEISGVNDFSFHSGQTGNIVEWNITDRYRYDYYIYRNDSISDPVTGPFSGISTTTYQINVDGLELGVYNFTIDVIDNSGNRAVHTVIVTVIDGDPPTLVSSMEYYSYAEGTSGNSLKWTYSDYNAYRYNITRNGFNIATNDIWESNTEFSQNIDGLTKGTYYFNLIIWDEAGNINSTITVVEVTDETLPELVDAPTNSTITESSTGNTISWTMTDNYVGRYVIYNNTIEVVNSTWKNNIPVVLNLDKLDRGYYNFTILILDASGNNITSTTWITILDMTDPELYSYPQQTDFIEGNTGHEISWVFHERHPETYTIFLDGQIYDTGVWINNTGIRVNLDAMQFGTYNFTIIVNDDSGNIANFTSMIEIIDKKIPVLKSAPSDVLITVGSTGNVIQYEAGDLHPGTFVFYVDGKIVEIGQWKNNKTIDIDIDGYDAGYYNVTMEIFDQSQNKVSHSIIIRFKDPAIIDTVSPTLEVESTVYPGDVDYVYGNWTTNEGDPVVNGTISVILRPQNTGVEYLFKTDVNGEFILELDYSDLPPGFYEWDIEFSKDGYQGWGIFTKQVEILAHQYRAEVDVPTNIVQGEEYFISVIVYYDNGNQATSLTLNSVENPQSGVAVGVSVEFTMVLVYDDGSRQVTKSAMTDDFGLALIRLSSLETSNLKSIDSFSIQIAESDINKPLSLSVEQHELPQVQPAEPELLELVRLWLIEYYYIVIISIILLFSGGFVYLRQRRKEQQRIQQLNESIKLAYEELKTLKSIDTIIIQTVHSINIYTEEFSSEVASSYLIGGMINAITNFLDEIDKSNTTGFEMMERDNMSITIHRATYTNFIVISKEKIPYIILAQIADVQEEIESHFKTYLENSQRGAKVLKPHQIYPIFEKGGFKLSLTHKLKLNEKEIRSLIKEDFISRILRKDIQLLYDFPTSEYYSEGGFDLEDLTKFLQSNGIGNKESARIIILAYHYNIIETELDPPEENTDSA